MASPNGIDPAALATPGLASPVEQEMFAAQHGGTENATNETPPLPLGNDQTIAPEALATPGLATTGTEGAPPPSASTPPPATHSKIDMLKAAGFKDNEINQWADSTRAKLTSAGFSPKEVDDYFGGPTPGETTLGQAFAGTTDLGALEGPAWDAYAQSGVTPMSHILSAFGMNAKEGYGADTLTSTVGDFDKFLKNIGAFNDYQNGRYSVFKSINEAFMRPAVLAMQIGEYALRDTNALLAGTQGALGQTAEEFEKAGHPILAAPFGAAAELLSWPAVETLGMTPHPAGVPQDVAEAKAMGVIGGNAPEDAQLNTTLRTHAQDARETAEQSSDLIPPTPGAAEAAEPPPGTTAVTAGVPGEEPNVPPLDIHQVARQIAPETFRAYDEAQTRRDTFFRWANELTEQREGTQAIDTQIQALRDKLAGGGVTGAQRADIAAQLEDLQNRRSTFAEQGARDRTIENLRQQGNAADTKMRDLAPQVSSAYREAETRMPSPEAPAPAEPVAPAAEMTGPTPPTVEPVPPEAAAPPTSTAESAEPRPTVLDIHNDAYQKLTAAGRSPELADAEAAIVDASYRARAAAFDGAKGTAGEMYAADAPDIAGSTKTPRASGKTTINDAGRTITLFEKADASTFMHEWGHNKLEELLADAKDDLAPQVLKDDAATVRKWLGATEDAEVTRAQHEKFARGFERYLMEGIAPSQALAQVFGKFRQWLTDVYQSVRNKLPQLNDDIRGVFDRLLTEPHERAVIAPEREAGFPTSHEHLADHVPPAHAIDTADQIRVEAKEVANATEPRGLGEPVPGSAARLGGEEPVGAGANEAGRNAAADREANGNGPATGPAAGAVGTHTESGEIGAGRGEVAEEGNRVPAGATAARGNVKVEASPDDPSSPFKMEGSKYVDKAGNINLDKLLIPEDVKASIREAVGSNDDFMANRRGVISDAEAWKLSDAFATHPAFLDRKAIGSAYNAEELIAARRLAVEASTKAMEIVQNGDPLNPKDVMAFEEAKLRFRMIRDEVLGKVAGGTAEAGRALRSLRMVIPGEDVAAHLDSILQESSGQTLYQVQEAMQLAKKLRTPQQMAKFMNDTTMTKLQHALVYYYINALLSGPITHLRYMVGNMANALVEPVVRLPVEAAWGSARVGAAYLRGGEVPLDRTYWREVGADLYGLGKGVMDGFPAAYDAMKTGVTPKLPGESSGLARTPFGAGANPIPGVVGTIIGTPVRAIGGLHAFSKQIRYEQTIQRLAVRQALMEGLEGATFKDRVSLLTQDPSNAMMDKATVETVEGLQRQAAATSLRENYMAPTDYNSLAAKLTQWENKNIMAKLMVPFVKIGAQMDKLAITEYSPLAAATPRFWRNLRSGTASADEAMSKLAVGIGLTGGTIGLVLNHMLTGDGPSDPKEQATWRMAGNKPNHLTIGGLSIPVAGLGYMGIVMHTVANMTESISGMNEPDHQFVAEHLLEGITRGLLDDTFLRDAKDTLDAIWHPGEYGTKFLTSFATNWLPFSTGMSQIARVVDPYARQTNTNLRDLWNSPLQTIFDAAKARIPFASESLQPRLDRFGMPLPSETGLPAYISQQANDPVVQAMNRLQIGIGIVPKQIDGVALNQNQYNEYNAKSGQLTKQFLNKLVALPAFQSWPLHRQLIAVQKAINDGREAARAALLAHDKTLRNAIVQINRDMTRGHMPPGGWPQPEPENAYTMH